MYLYYIAAAILLQALDSLCFYTVPSGAPQNVSALSISPSSVIVRWTPPESQYQNGVILEYLVTVENGNSVELWSNHTELVVRNLLPHTVYSFAVAAINDIGVGPFSSPSVMRTLEDGK